MEFGSDLDLSSESDVSGRRTDEHAVGAFLGHPLLSTDMPVLEGSGRQSHPDSLRLARSQILDLVELLEGFGRSVTTLVVLGLWHLEVDLSDFGTHSLSSV